MVATDHLKALHTALIDARQGYEEAVEDSDKPGLAALFRDMIALRERHHAELHQLLLNGGETPNEQGSFMATVHKTVIGARAAVTGLDEHALSSFASGEERIMDDYDEAIAEAQSAPEAAAVLTRQKGEVAGKIAEMKRLAAG